MQMLGDQWCRTTSANLSNASPELKQRIGKGMEKCRNNEKGLKKNPSAFNRLRKQYSEGAGKLFEIRNS